MDYKQNTEELVKKIIDSAQAENKLSGFCIGNTAKFDERGLYFTPVRNALRMVVAGVIVYSEQQAVDIVKIIDGRVDYVLVDAEKKIPERMSRSGEPANVERAVRETIKKSSLWSYKGNDLAVEALDGLLTYLTKDSISGIGGKKVVILGAGNLGAKLAIKLVERGARVFITRRDEKKVSLIAEAINCIKPVYTTAKVIGMTDNIEAARGADILVGMTQGVPVVTVEMVENLSHEARIIDGGKGTLYPEAIRAAEEKNIEIYRLDVSAAFEGVLNSLFAIEDMVEKRLGRGVFSGEPVVSGGLMGRKGDIVVDRASAPQIIYGVADGSGDFIRDLSEKQICAVERVRKAIKGKQK